MIDLRFREVRTVVDGREAVLDVEVAGGVVTRVGTASGSHAREEVDGRGLVLLPGAIDLHVHLREPGLTHKEDLASGTRAAVAAGVTTVLDMPNTLPPTLTREALEAKATAAAATAGCRVRLFAGLARDNLDALEAAAGHPAFAGVKVFLGSTTGDLLLDDLRVVERALDRVPALFAFHAELETELRARRPVLSAPGAGDHHRLRPAEAAIAGARVVAGLGRVPGRRLHLCHVSCAGELDALAAAPGASPVTTEATPHHLWFDAADVARLGNRLKVNPPVREAAERDALRAALAAGRLDAVATDHAPHTLEEKARDYLHAPSGAPGLDTGVAATLRLVQTGELTLARAAEVLCEAPARIAGLPGLGRIGEGLEADLALYDLGRTWVPVPADLGTRCGWSPFEGIELAARPIGVWVGGRRVSGGRGATGSSRALP